MGLPRKPARFGEGVGRLGRRAGSRNHWCRQPQTRRTSRIMISPNFDTAGAAIEPTDEELMQDITDRNPKALAALYRRHGERLRSVISNVVHEPADADDVLQEILLQIWKEAANYSAKAGRPLGWIVTLARRRAIDRLRRCQAYSRAKDRFTEQLDVRFPSTSPRRSSDEYARSDMRTFLERHIQALPAFQGQA